jgi:hypothetical protein
MTRNTATNITAISSHGPPAGQDGSPKTPSPWILSNAYTSTPTHHASCVRQSTCRV